MALTGTPRPSVIDEIVDRILDAINSGELQPGSRLPSEPELATRLGVGRTSLREALGRMRALGVIDVQRGRGTYVAVQPLADPRVAFMRWTAQHHSQVLGLFEVRMALEAGAASLAAVRHTHSDIDALHRSALEHLEAGTNGDLDLLVESDQRFHWALIAAAHNEALERMYSLLVAQLLDYRKKSLALDGAPHRSASDHLDIWASVSSGDPDRARQSVLAHLASLYSEVQEAGGMTGFSRQSSVPKI
jgi:GntR family transcriptional repressor for pyruvate dehydrogenase complex